MSGNPTAMEITSHTHVVEREMVSGKWHMQGENGFVTEAEAKAYALHLLLSEAMDLSQHRRTITGRVRIKHVVVYEGISHVLDKAGALKILGA